MPLPRPRSVICSPSHIRNIVPVTSVIAVIDPEREARVEHEARLRLERDRDAERLEEREPERRVARVLRDLAPAGFAFLLQRLERRHDHRAQLHDDRRRDVRHDAEREDREARQRAAREHVEQAEDAALLRAEQLVEHGRVDARHRDVRPDPVDDERAQQEPQPPLQIGVLGSALQRRIGSWPRSSSFRPCKLAPFRRRCRRRLRWPPSRPWSPSTPESFTAFSSLPVLITFAVFAVGGTRPAAFSASRSISSTGSFARSRQAHFGGVVLRQRHEAALRQPALQRHLAAFEADLVEAARARLLALVAAAGGLAEPGADAAADAAARLLAARRRA